MFLAFRPPKQRTTTLRPIPTLPLYLAKQCKMGIWCEKKSNRNVWLTIRLIPLSTLTPARQPKRGWGLIWHWHYVKTVTDRAKLCIDSARLMFACRKIYSAHPLVMSFIYLSPDRIQTDLKKMKVILTRGWSELSPKLFIYDYGITISSLKMMTTRI